MSGDTTLNAAKVAMLKKHLALVFKHEIDPSHGDAKHQAELNDIHAAKPVPGSQIHEHGPGPFMGGVDAHGLVMRC